MYPYDSPDGLGSSSPFNAPFNPTMIPTDREAWKLNPYYLTPSYTAPYRPDYGGYEGFYDNYAYNPGFTGAFMNVNPLSRQEDPYYSSMTGFNDRNWMSMATGVIDKGMDITQMIGSPLLAAYIANKVMNFRTNTPDRYAATWAKFTGANVRNAMRGSSSVAYTIGGKFGRGVGKSVFSVAEKFLPSSLMSKVGYRAFRHGALNMAYGAAGLASVGALPIMLGEAAMQGIQDVAIDPYIDTRTAQNTLKREFQNTYMGDGIGTVISNMGISGYASGKIAKGLIGEGIRDIRLGGGEDYSKLLKSTIDAGMFSNSGMLNSESVISKVKTAADQALLVMRVAKEPSVQNAVKQIGEFMKMGADPLSGAVRNAMTSIGMSSTASGISAYNMMNTTGMQGQYMFQSMGMLPYVGQITASASRAAMTSAYRSGLISPGLMAMMGGHEGATQSSVQGLLQGISTPYSQIRLANRYMFGSGSSGLTGNLLNFSGNFAKDPVNTMGLMALNQGIMQSHDLNANGISGVMDQVQEIAQRMGLLRKGKLGAGAAHQIMQSMGMSQDQIIALLNQARAISDPKALKLQVGAMDAASMDNYMQFLNQEQLTGMGKLISPIKRGYRAGIEYASRPFRHLSQWAGGVSDAGSEMFTRIQFGGGRDSSLLNYLTGTENRPSQQAVPYGLDDLSKDDYWGTKLTQLKIFSSALLNGLSGNDLNAGTIHDSMRTISDEQRLKVMRGEVSGYRVAQRKSKNGEFDDFVNTWARKDLNAANAADAETIRASRQLASFGFSRENDREKLMTSLRNVSRVAGRSEWMDDADNLLHYNFRKFTGAALTSRGDRFITVPAEATSGGNSLELFDKLDKLAPGAFSRDAKGFMGYASSLGLAKQIYANGQGIDGSEWMAGEGKTAISALGKALGYGDSADPEKIFEAARKLMVISAQTETGNANSLVQGIGRKRGESDADYLKRAAAEKAKVGITLGGKGTAFPTTFASDETAIRHVQNLDSDTAARERLRVGYNSSQLDFQGYITAEASLEFKAAVREFGNHVRDMAGRGEGGANGGSDNLPPAVTDGYFRSAYNLFTGTRATPVPKTTATNTSR